jgi:hypothetical protein
MEAVRFADGLQMIHKEDAMSILSFEAVIEHGKVILPAHVRLPERTRVYVVVPDIQTQASANMYSPRLAHKEQLKDFILEVAEDKPDVGV